MRLESLENRELLNAAPMTDLPSGSAQELAAALNHDAVAPIDLSNAVADAEQTAAADVPSTVVTSLEDKVDPNDGVVTLREAITVYANPGDTVVFDASLAGGTIVLSGSQLSVEKAISIDATALWNTNDNVPGLTIDGNAASRVLYVNAGTDTQPVSIKGLAIENGKTTQYGGGVYMEAGVVNVDHCSIKNNTIVGNDIAYGGGIYIKSGTLTVTESSISDNSASASLGYNNYGTARAYGGGLYNNGTLSIANSSISNNKLTAYIYNSNNNSSNTFGGGVYNAGVITITDTTISQNSVKSTSNYTNTTLKAYGAGFYNYQTATIVSTTIEQNTALKGGGIYNEGTLSTTSSSLSANKAESAGGIANVSGNLVLTNCTVTANSATKGSGGGVENTATLKAQNNIFAMNYSSTGTTNVNDSFTEDSDANIVGYNPGFVVAPVFDAVGTLTNADELDLHLRSDSIAIDAGSNIGVSKRAVDLDGNTRIYGTTVDAGAYEYQGDRDDEPLYYSTVVNSLEDTIDPTDNKWTLREALWFTTQYETITFANNLVGTITLKRGQLVVDRPVCIDGNGKITIDADEKSRVMFVEVSAKESEESPIVLTGLDLIHGKTTGNGGGIYNNTATIQIVDASVDENSASSGGGIYSDKGVVTIVDSTVDLNNATTSGGGIYTNAGTIDISASSLDENTISGSSVYGGGLYSDAGNITIFESSVFQNKLVGTSGAYGGGIYNKIGVLSISDSIVSQNTVVGKSEAKGGGVYNNGALTITGSTLSDNSTSVSYSGSVYAYGGGLYNSGTGAVVSNTTIKGNKTTAYTSSNSSYNCNAFGGGVYNSGSITISDAQLKSNTAKSTRQYTSNEALGGGVYNSNTANLTAVAVEQNSATQGGGVYNAGTFTAANSSISANTAETAGGVRNYSGKLTLNNCTISANAATNGGGGGVDNNATILAVNSIIAMNYSSAGVVNVSDTLAADSVGNIIGYNPGFVVSPVFDAAGKLTNANKLNLRLRSDSIAINVGQNAGISKRATDLDGNKRIYNVTVDAGAYEYQGDRKDAPLYYSTVVNSLEDSINLSDNKWTLREALWFATEPVTITFASNLRGTITLSLGELSIDKAISIDGNDKITIDANQNSRVFYIEASKASTENDPIVLSGLEIINGKTTLSGGGIYNNSAYVEIVDSYVDENYAGSNGGGIYNYSGSITIENSTVDMNHAAGSYGGGVYNNSGTLTITGSSCDENTLSSAGDSYGGGIYNKTGSLTISDSSVYQNNISGNYVYGGGIYNESGVISISDVDLEQNTMSGTSYAYGGGLYNKGNATLENSFLKDNVAKTSSSSSAVVYGGGLYNTGTIVVSNTTIEGNSASSYSSGNYSGATLGGGVYNSGTITLSNSTLKANSVKSSRNNTSVTLTANGGGLYNTGTATVESVVIEENTAKQGGGLYNEGTLTATFALIAKNSAETAGGVRNESGTITLTNSTIAANAATNGENGGISNSATIKAQNNIIAMNYSASGVVNVSDSLTQDSVGNVIGYNPGFIEAPLFDNNGVLTNADTLNLRLRSDSIAIDAGSNQGISRRAVDLDGNTRIYGDVVDAGAYEYQGDRDDEPLFYSTVVNSLEDSIDPTDDKWTLREAIWFASKYETITFADNLQGTITLERGDIDIDRPICIKGNGKITIDANHHSRVVYIETSAQATEETPVVIENLALIHGQTTSYGGGVYNYSARINLSNVSVEENTASNGGGIYNSKGVLSIDSSSASLNNTTGYGGGVYNHSGTITLSNSEINENTVTAQSGQYAYGGGLYNYSGNIVLSHSTVHQNVATGASLVYGAGIHSGSGTLKISDSLISDNKSAGMDVYGVGICNYNATLSIDNSTIVDNHGTASYTSNYTDAFGGGVYNRGTGVVNNTIIARNSTSSYNSYSSSNERSLGGGVYNCGTLTVNNVTIVNNTTNNTSNGASTNGGGIYNTQTLSAYNTIVAENTAKTNADVYSSNTPKGEGNLSSYVNWNGGNNVKYNSALPLFADAENGDFRLADGSQAIDMGLNKYAPSSTDLDGRKRILGYSVDAGAYEADFAIEITVDAYAPATQEATLSWAPLVNAAQYALEISTDGGATWNEYARLAETTATVADVEAGNAYVFRIYGITASGTTIESESVRVFAPVSIVTDSSTYCAGETIVVSLVGAESAEGNVRWYQVTPEGDVEIESACYSLSYTPTTADYALKVVVTGTGDSQGSAAELLVNPVAPSVSAEYNAKTQQATLVWNTIVNAVSYKVMVSRNNGATWTVGKTGVKDTTVTMNNVYVGQAYDFKIVGISAAGTETQSLQTSLVPFKATVNCDAYALGDTINLTIAGSDAAAYDVKWYQETKDGNIEIPGTAGSLEYVPVSDLYNVLVVVTGIGASTGVNAELRITNDRSVGEVTLQKYNSGSRQAIIQWDPITDVAGYKVMISKDDGQTWVKYASIADPDKTFVAVNGIYPAHSYQFKVLGIKDSGVSSSYREGTIEPIKIVSNGKPYYTTTAKAITLQASTPANVDVRWYYITETGDVEIEEAHNLLSYKIPTRTYEIRVVATGSGASEGFVSSINIPRPDGKITAEPLSSSKALLSWPELPGAATYVVKRSTDGGETWITYKKDLTEPYCEASGLYSGNLYMYSVTGYSADGKAMLSVATGSIDRTTTSSAVIDEAFADFFDDDLFVEI